ncbi:MAG: hypothetical protein IT522_09490 [Burkholderiales bacterium]|nr:hypothetical protein [Burkholderiales bacterium]
MMRARAYALAAVLCVHAAGGHAAADDILARSRATYAALASYADSGTIDAEFGTAAGLGREHHDFRTVFRGPRQLLFDFTKANHADRFVVWSDAEAFHTWWKATGSIANYPKGQGLSAFVTGSVPTLGALTMVTPWLFPKAGLVGILTELSDVTEAGSDTIAGHPCRKIVGTAQSVYGATGHVTNVRRVAVWIDVATLLVRRIAEDASEGQIVSRRTYTFDPQANPTIDEAQLRFVVPAR